jgi:isoleucyl-tRNA synthetase
MSKSLGNVVDANKTVEQYGADILRLWVASTDFKNDLAVSQAIIKQVQDNFSKIRNTWRFLLSNLYDYQEMKELLPLDRWIISRFQRLLQEVKRAYAEYEYHRIYHSVHDFCCNDLSALYLDMQKDNLYCNKPDSHQRRSCQQAVRIMLVDMVKLMAPILTFTCEDIYEHIQKLIPAEQAKFVLLTGLPQPDEALIDEGLEKKYEDYLKLKDEVYKVLEKQRAAKVIASSVEAKVIIKNTKDRLQSLNIPELEQFLIVSQVSLQEANQLEIIVEKAAGEKCVRCWKYYSELNSEYICQRCAEACKK